MSGLRVREADRPGDLGWIVQRHGELYAAEEGYDLSFESMVAAVVGRFATERDPDRERAWVAEVDDERAGCIMCTGGEDDGTALLRVLLVEPAARGHGAGRALVATCVGFARDAGYRRMRLWTVRGLDPARRLYEDAGFRLVAEEPHPGFGSAVVAQIWLLDPLDLQ